MKVLSCVVLLLMVAGTVLGQSAGVDIGAGYCRPDWVEYRSDNVNLNQQTVMTGFFDAPILSLTEAQLPVAGSAGGLPCFEWGADAARAKIRHLCPTAKWRITYWISALNTNFSAHTVIGGIGLAEDSTLVYSDMPKEAMSGLYMGDAVNQRVMFTNSMSGVSLGPNSRIALQVVNQTSSTVNINIFVGTKLRFDRDCS